MKTVITSSDKSLLNFSELKRYKDLFKYLSLRDVSIRYKQTWIGFGWSVIRPIINIIIFGCISLLINKNQSITSNFINVSMGVIFWQLISTSITEISNSLTANANILTKVYFPKLILPLSSLLVCFIDFLISLILFIILFIIIEGLPSWQLVFLPIVVMFGLLFSIGFGLLFSTASVKYRDVKFILPFVMQVLFYSSPVFISSSYILKHSFPDVFKVIYQINPLVQLLNLFKFCFYGQFENFNIVYLLISILLTIILLIISINYFLKFEKSFTDYI